MNKERYINLLKEKFDNYNFIDLVIIYGSVLTNRFNDNSDIDIAVASRKIIQPMFLLELKKDLEMLCKREIDIFDLSKDEGLINYKIITEGLVVKNNFSLFSKYHVNALIFYEDFFRKYQKIQEEKIRRFLNG